MQISGSAIETCTTTLSKRCRWQLYLLSLGPRFVPIHLRWSSCFSGSPSALHPASVLPRNVKKLIIILVAKR